MALNVFSSIVSTISDQVAFTATNELDSKVIWKDLDIKSVEISGEAAQTDHPLSNVQYNDDSTYTNLSAEDIQTIKIIRPSIVRVIGICADISTIESVTNVFADTQVSIVISTKSIIIPDLVLSTINIEQSGNMLSAAEITMELEQAEPPTATTYSPSQAGDVSEYGIRIQSLKTAPVSLSTLASKVAQKISAPVSVISGALLGSQGESFLIGTGGSKLS
jgi:hypothetical protein